MVFRSNAKSDSRYFKRGCAVEININKHGIGPWFSGTVIRPVRSGRRFFVKFHNNNMFRRYVRLHQLRPLLRPESYQPEFKPGDEVDAFHNNGWWEGHIAEDRGNGRFGVCLRNSTTMVVFQKEQLRTHRKWMIDDNNWVFSNNSDHNKDNISELPDNVLLHIMSFLDTKEAVRTCVLSKGWKNLCKSITHLTFSSFHQSLHQYKRRFRSCKRFAMWVLARRDDSHSLFNLTLDNWIENYVDEGKESYLDRVMHYAVTHNVQDLTMLSLSASLTTLSLSSIFCCKSLTSLKLCTEWNPFSFKLPESLHMPALKNLHLEGVPFTTNDNNNGYVEPFSNCGVLDTLFIGQPYFFPGMILCISNITVSILTIKQGCRYYRRKESYYQIVLSTPNLRSCTMDGLYVYKLSSTCDLSFIGEVNINIWEVVPSSMIISCLQLFANVKTLTLTSCFLYRILLEYFLKPNPLTPLPPQPPCFVRLESLKVKNDGFMIAKEGLIKTVTYLLQNSSFKATPKLIFSEYNNNIMSWIFT